MQGGIGIANCPLSVSSSIPYLPRLSLFTRVPFFSTAWFLPFHTGRLSLVNFLRALRPFHLCYFLLQLRSVNKLVQNTLCQVDERIR